MEQHFLGKVNTKAIIEKDGKILITKDVHDRETWDLVGGRMNMHETPEEAVRREAVEELGVEIELSGVVLMEQIKHIQDKDPHLFITFRAILRDPKKHFKLPSSELSEAIWVDRKSIKNYVLYDNCVNPLEKYWEELARQ